MLHKSIVPHFPLEIEIAKEPVNYQFAIEKMQMRIAAIHEEKASGLLWFLEHPSLYTAGTSAKEKDLLKPDEFPVYEAGRGGQYTYHGPGQLIIYCLVDLRKISLDVRKYVKTLEYWILSVLKIHGVEGALYADRIGVWVRPPETKKESKIAAIGVRVTHGITWHGLSFNIEPNLTHYNNIVPCGISDFGVTSLRDIGLTATLDEIICAFCATIPTCFVGKVQK
ncbi:MAG: lipoyl(octanoyl) transferase LipB [Pseudomonadota bacterium]